MSRMGSGYQPKHAKKSSSNAPRSQEARAGAAQSQQIPSVAKPAGAAQPTQAQAPAASRHQNTAPAGAAALSLEASSQRVRKKKRRGLRVLLIIVIILVLLFGGAAFAWSRGMLEGTPLGPTANTIAAFVLGTHVDQATLERAVGNAVRDETAKICKPSLAKGDEAAEFYETHDGFPTPLVAEYDGVKIHSPVHVANLNGILFHQAATKWGLPLDTKLPEADEEKVFKTKSYDIKKPLEQTEGDEYIKAKALHLWRRGTPTKMDSSIDVGAEAGDTVYAPVTGTVVLVRTYRLYDTCDDYEIHIQPGDRDDLDVVEIHVTDVAVKAGDKVEGGVTPIAKVRDLAAEDITDIQLAYYTKPGHGNHTHVQINDTKLKDDKGKTYRETRLKDAVKV